jgi:hypothetical protein
MATAPSEAARARGVPEPRSGIRLSSQKARDQRSRVSVAVTQLRSGGGADAMKDRTRLVVLGLLCFAVFGLPMDALGRSSPGDLEPIVAGLPRSIAPRSTATDVLVGGHEVSALPILVRVDAPAAHAASDPGQTTVLAYSLDASSPTFAAATDWTATSVRTPGISGIRSSFWIAKNAGPLATEPRPQALELAARQVAIWYYTNGFAASPSTVPDAEVRDRATSLIRAAANAPANITVSPTSISVAATISDVETDSVVIEVLLGTNGENSFCTAQKLDVRVFGGWGTVKTGDISNLKRIGPGRYRTDRTSALPG